MVVISDSGGRTELWREREERVRDPVMVVGGSSGDGGWG